MNYLPKSRGRNSFKKPLLILVGVFAAGALIFFLASGVIVSVASPLWKGEHVALAKLSFVGDFFRTKNALINENERLKERLAALELEVADRASSHSLNRHTETGGIISTILARPPQTPYDTLVIDAGSNDSLGVGAVVFMAEGPVLGAVREVSASTAKVKLFSAPGEKTAALLERHNIPVTLEGVGGGNFKIVLPREAEVVAGDRVLSADILSHLLAVVGEVKMEPTDSFKEVLARSPINIFNIHFVVIQP